MKQIGQQTPRLCSIVAKNFSAGSLVDSNRHYGLKNAAIAARRRMARAGVQKIGMTSHPANRNLRRASWSPENPGGRWRSYKYDQVIARDRGLDIFWLTDDALADCDNLPPLEVIAQEIVDALEVALEQFSLIVDHRTDSIAGYGQ